MKTTRTIMGEAARRAVHAGVNAIYRPVALTLGPNPRKALLYRTYNRGARIVDDGHIVAQCQEPKDPHARMAASVFKEACQRTNEKVGDGTATTAVIGGALFNYCYAKTSEGANNMKAEGSGTVDVTTLRNQILESARRVKEAVQKSAKKVETEEQLAQIATVSVGGDAKLGALIAEMAWEAGVDGFIDVVEGFKGEIETDLLKGFRFPAKPAAKAFVNNPARYEMVMDDCPVLVTNYACDNNDIGMLLRQFNTAQPGKWSTSKIVVIAPSFSENILIQMVNTVKAGYNVYPVKVPALRTEQFEDLAVYCGARFVDKNKGHTLRAVQPTDLGFFVKLIVKDTENREDAVMTGGKGEIELERVRHEEVPGGKKGEKVEKVTKSSPVEDRIAVLKGQLAETQVEAHKKLLERRIASMASAVGVIRVGDSTQASSLDRKLKIEDAVYACKAALHGGYVRGGGLCLLEISKGLEDGDPLKGAIAEPYSRIQASVEGGVKIGDEIIDPAEAELCAVEHAAGVVANLITVEILTPEADEPMPGEGELAIARELGFIGLAMRKQQGLLRENEEEMERDRLGGLTVDEHVMLDNG